MGTVPEWCPKHTRMTKQERAIDVALRIAPLWAEDLTAKMLGVQHLGCRICGYPRDHAVDAEWAVRRYGVDVRAGRGRVMDVIPLATAKQLFRKMANGFSDALTTQAAAIRDNPKVWTSDEVADMLTEFAVETSRPHEAFGNERCE